MALVGSLLKKGIHFSNIVANRKKSGTSSTAEKNPSKIACQSPVH
jgi:hypothetical protein